MIPQPTRIRSLTEAPFTLTAATRIVAAPELARSASWFTTELRRLTGLEIATRDTESPAIRLSLVVGDAELATLPPTGGVRADDADPDAERYALDIRESGISLHAATAEGIFRGLTTLLQIVVTTEAGSDRSRTLPAVNILDTPRFGWRGLSFDVVRTFYTPDEVRRVIDLLALYKANVLHLHLTDSEGWRLQIDSWPLLTEIGSKGAAAGRSGGFYTKDEYRDIVQYAADRFITIVPEFDMPGHTAAIYEAYPELAGNGIDDPAAGLAQGRWFQVMHPDHPRIFAFITEVLTEIAELTPGAYIHIGGDEALGMDEELYARFIERAMPIVRDIGRKPLGWQETARAGLTSGDIAQLWISPRVGEGIDLTEIDFGNLPEAVDFPPEQAAQLIEAVMEMLKIAALDLDKALDQGANILVSQSTEAYLDTQYLESPSDPDQEADWKRLGMPFYPKSTVAEFFSWDPASLRPTLK
ncbi:MAG TPA: family 20 glycosylhydrolase, partial [Thermomicrobiales bacterium]|nr:family 20 glycosylhydrolase [Thermomicrobiales bacterium]